MRNKTRPAVRNETILRLFMLWFLDSVEAVAFLDDEVESHEQRLAVEPENLLDPLA